MATQNLLTPFKVPEVSVPELKTPETKISPIPSTNKDLTSEIIHTAIDRSQHEISKQNETNLAAIEAFKKAQELVSQPVSEGDIVPDFPASQFTPNVMGFDIRSYATDPNHEKSVASIAEKIGKFNTLSDLNNYIKKNFPSSPVSGEMIVSASAKYKIPWEILVAMMQQDSSMGTKGKGARTFNPGNVGNDDAGNIVNWGDWQSGVNAVAEWLAKHRVQTKNTHLDSGTKMPLGVVTTPFGGQTRIEGNHPGIDIANEIGTPVPSFTQGTVTAVVTGKQQADINNPNDPNKGYGNFVIVTDQDGNQFRYSHLNNAFVKVGQEVGRGTVVGGMGNTGSTYSTSGGTGSHLDLRIRNAAGKYLDPSLFL